MKTLFNPLDPTLPRCEYRTVPAVSVPERLAIASMLRAGWRVYRPGMFSVQLVRNINQVKAA